MRLGATVATIILVAIAFTLALPLIVTFTSQSLEALEGAMPTSNPGPFKPLYDAIYGLYTTLKPLVTDPLSVALLVAIGLALMGLEVYWRERRK